jgi:type II secretory pathway component GspD/PulD (secretin)
MVDAELIETTVTKLKDLGIEWGSGTEGDLVAFFPGGVDVDGEPLSAGRQTRFPFGILDDRAPSLPTPFPTSTLSFNDFQGVLQALESDSDTKVLARPKVMTLDNESAVIRLTSDEAIGFETTTAATAGTTQAEAERTRTGIVLVVTPQVNEHNQITMIVEPSVTKTVVSQLTPPAGTTQPRDPKTRGARALVRVRSGDTLVLGGLIDRTDSETRRKVPILADIPFLGEAFKNTETNDTASELIVFVTPRILTEPPDAQMAAAGAPGQWKAAQEGAVPAVVREQEQNGSRQTFIEQTLNRLEQTGP